MSNNICIYCDNTADTKEHVPAKQLFKGIPESSLITVPSCQKCNREFQADEDFFRQFFAGFLMDRSAKAKEFMNGAVMRSIKRRPALAQQMFSQMRLVNLYTKSGIYVGRRTMYHVSSLDFKRVNSVVEKIIKGLFFHEFKQTIPNGWIIKILWITPKVEKEQDLANIARTLKWKIIKGDTFAYGWEFVPGTYQSVWILDFFKTPLFYVLVLDKKTANVRKES